MTTRTLLSLMVALALTGCATDTDTGLQRGTGAACAACTSDLDCAQGLLCDQDAFACKSVAQLKAKKTGAGPQCDADCWVGCGQVGNCWIVTNPVSKYQQCGPKSDADCQQSEVCKGYAEHCKVGKNTDGWPECVK